MPCVSVYVYIVFVGQNLVFILSFYYFCFYRSEVSKQIPGERSSYETVAASGLNCATVDPVEQESCITLNYGLVMINVLMCIFSPRQSRHFEQFKGRRPWENSAKNIKFPQHYSIYSYRFSYYKSCIHVLQYYCITSLSTNMKILLLLAIKVFNWVLCET